MPDERLKFLARRERFYKDPLSIRLGNLASNLARLKSFTKHDLMGDAALRIVRESKHFIEWSASEAGLDLQVELLALQRELAWQELKWSVFWEDPCGREQIADRADHWAQRILMHSGLMTPEFSSI
jgi:hypothetical protein